MCGLQIAVVSGRGGGCGVEGGLVALAFLAGVGVGSGLAVLYLWERTVGSCVFSFQERWARSV